MTRTTIAGLDKRFGLAKGGSKFLDHIFPDHWSFFLGEIAMYSFIVLVLTGVWLTFFYVDSMRNVIYHGVYKPLDGVKMSEAYASVVNISFKYRMGLMMRQVHHWAAEVFIGTIVIHCCRIFFTSAYRRPRETNWCIGLSMLFLAIANGYLGYVMLNDNLAGSGNRIGYSICESIPIIGQYLATFIWGGQYPGTLWVHRYYIAHVLLIPLLIAGLLGLHLFLIFHQDHTQWPGKGRKEDNVVGDPMWPVFAAKTTGLFLMVAAGLCLLGGIAQIEPVWSIGPYHPAVGIYAAQPDWYITWLEGALRITPNWEWTGWGHTVPWMTFGAVVVFPVCEFALLGAWPWIEGRFMRNQATHHLLVAPRTRPIHTAIGAAFFTFNFVLFMASGDDVISKFFHLSLNQAVWSFRAATVGIPPIIGLLTYRICKDLQKVPDRRKLRQPARVRMTESRFYVATIEAYAPDRDEMPLATPDVIVQSGEGD
ncbi:MAG: cytochrome bc1 complex cytochrome b subunit [Acidimicrobiales bacterium]